MYKYFILLFLILYVWAFFIEPNLLVVKRYKSEKFKGKKIVFASDFHIGKHDLKRLRKIVNLINRQNPDLVLSGGDFIKGYSGKSSLDIDTIAKEISKIKAPIYTVLGNHDGKFDKFTVKNTLEKYGIKVLLNSFEKFKEITIAGIDDLQTGLPNVQTALTEDSVILLTHNPDVYYDIKQPVDLILAGHVHGGQVRLPKAIIVPSKYGTKFACGDFNETGNRMIVTKGLGTSILTVRFLTLPEIIVIN